MGLKRCITVPRRSCQQGTYAPTARYLQKKKCWACGHALKDKAMRPPQNCQSARFCASWSALPEANTVLEKYSCFGCGKIPNDPSHAHAKCGRCGVACYCCKECQLNDWRSGNHKDCCSLLAEISLALTSPPRTALQFLHATIGWLLFKPSNFQRNIVAILQTLAGKVVPCKFRMEDIQSGSFSTKMLPQHPGFGLGNSQNAPLQSCKMAASMIMVLCSELDPDFIAVSAGWLARSAGAFKSVSGMKPNCGELGKAIAEAMVRAEVHGLATCIGVSLSDLHVFTVPWKSGIAHSFCVAVSPGVADSVEARLYQAFGPPDVGYGINEWCFGREKGKEVFGKPELQKFSECYAALETSATWEEARQWYGQLFDVDLNEPGANYPVKIRTTIRTSTFSVESVQMMASVFEVPAVTAWLQRVGS